MPTVHPSSFRFDEEIINPTISLRDHWRTGGVFGINDIRRLYL